MAASETILCGEIWMPSKENRALLDYALAKIKSVPYAVTARWTFYQLVQAGIVEKKKGSTFEYLTSKARKCGEALNA